MLTKTVTAFWSQTIYYGPAVQFSPKKVLHNGSGVQYVQRISKPLDHQAKQLISSAVLGVPYSEHKIIMLELIPDR